MRRPHGQGAGAILAAMRRTDPHVMELDGVAKMNAAAAATADATAAAASDATADHLGGRSGRGDNQATAVQPIALTQGTLRLTYKQWYGTLPLESHVRTVSLVKTARAQQLCEAAKGTFLNIQ